ncbi:MAG: ATP-binding cassette domain-containing protein [Actinomycetota bacterium]|jgi:ABC-type branched-subunit amino acid transport system ATPase component
MAVLTAGLEVSGLTVAYSGNVALSDVSLQAPIGVITGLIGPNGAGKTTLFNACTGILRPSAGRIRFNGQDVTAVSAPRRAQLGLGRTFQRMELFDSLDVRSNVALGSEAMRAGSNPVRHVLELSGDRAEIEEATRSAMERCGISALADRPVVALSTGQRRLVELARALAARRSLLLLDEPSSGLDHQETARFGSVLREVVNQDGNGIFLVEHDMDLVMAVCDYLYVLDFGQLIAEGTPEAIRNSAVVRRAYLGEDLT